MIVTVETDIGITGIADGGLKDTLTQCAGTLIGKDPFKIEHLWQEMYIGWFYPPGREKIHAQGALDIALWDIKGKALDVPVHQILGGTVRNYCERYATGAGTRSKATDFRQRIRDNASAVMDAGFRAYRTSTTDNTATTGGTYYTREQARYVAQIAEAAREGVGDNGEWCIDFHQRFDFNDSLRACRMIEEFDPLFVEDPVRDEHRNQDIPKLSTMTTCPLAPGEEWGQRYDFNDLVENHDIDYIRATLPNVGGITEMMKIMAMCETHAVGIVPHFTGPIATAALVHVLSTFPGVVIFEGARGGPEYMPECYDSREAKVFPNNRPGLGVTLDLAQVKLIGEITEPSTSLIHTRPDGSLTHW
ncbi:mandelate racemase/muconate lactonizing enzyme family protein [Candidatus Latescibacterota bacterium]